MNAFRALLRAESRKPEDWPFDLAVAAYLLIGKANGECRSEQAALIVMEAARPYVEDRSHERYPVRWAFNRSKRKAITLHRLARR